MLFNLLIFRILMAISQHQACEVGRPLDYYNWVDAHPYYSVPWSLEDDIYGDYWLMQDGSDYVLFVFAADISDTLASGTSVVHGKCARLLNLSGN